MKIVQVYYSNSGTPFDTERECLHFEAKVELEGTALDLGLDDSVDKLIEYARALWPALKRIADTDPGQ